jgi:hypothetical protein
MGCRFCQGTTTKKHKSLDLFLKIRNLFPKAEEYGDGDFFKNFPVDEFLCPECKEIIPEIVKVHSDNNKIEIKCKIHGTREIDIKEYYEKTKNFNYYGKKCYNCEKECRNIIVFDDEKNMQNSHDAPDDTELSNKMSKYCYECDKIFCNECCKNGIIKGNIKHKKSHLKNCIDINERTKKCKKHPKETFKYFCLDCETHICKDAKDRYHKGHDIKELNDEIMHCENEFLGENKNLREIIMKKNIQLAKIIKLNTTILAKYERDKNNYYYLESLKNIGESIEEEASRDSMHVECVLHKMKIEKKNEKKKN